MSPTTAFGVLVPTREAAMSGDSNIGALVAFARRAWDAGFTSAWAGDSLTARPRAEPLTVLAAVAGAVPGMAIGTAALTASLRHPVLSAHSLATLDRLAGGNLVIGVGAGFPVDETKAEFEAVGVPFRQRYRRLDETVALWRTLWNHEARDARFDGNLFAYSGPRPQPVPTQAGGPPVWLAGGGPAALRRVGQSYDGWLPYPPTPDAYRAGWETIRAEAESTGRDAGSIGRGLYVTVNIRSKAALAREELDRFCAEYYGLPLELMEQVQAFCAGPASQVADWLHSYLALGVTHVVVRIGSIDRDRQLEELSPILGDLSAARSRS